MRFLLLLALLLSTGCCSNAPADNGWHKPIQQDGTEGEWPPDAEEEQPAPAAPG